MTRRISTPLPTRFEGPQLPSPPFPLRTKNVFKGTRFAATVLRGDELELLKALPGPAVAAGRDGFILFANQAACELFEYDRPENLIGCPITLLMPERYIDQHDQGFDRYRRTGATRLVGRRIHASAATLTGKEEPIELAIHLFRRDDGSDLIVGLMEPTGSSKGYIDFCVDRIENKLPERDYKRI